MSDWVLLAYRLPREPSTPRITLWRQLRRLGAVQVVDGLVALPADARTIEAFDWLAEEVVEAGGEAWTWRGQAGSKAQERALRERMSSAIGEEYRALLAGAETARSDPTRRAVGRLRRELHKVESRDHVAPKERDEARRAIDGLVAALDAAEAKEAAR